jgi:hypothetical protein
VTEHERRAARRDGRLLIALVLFVGTAGAALVQIGVLSLWFQSALHDDWTYFLEWFPSYAMPALEPGQYCLGDCSPDLPFFAAWIAIGFFGLGMAVLAYSWWRPRSS